MNACSLTNASAFQGISREQFMKQPDFLPGDFSSYFNLFVANIIFYLADVGHWLSLLPLQLPQLRVLLALQLPG